MVSSTVTLRNHGESMIANEVGDTYTDEAIDKARELHAQGVTFTRAYVDRFDGLVLLGPQEDAWHFQTTLCGYAGTGPTTTARILELFEFGTVQDLTPRLVVGGDSAKETFTRP